MQSSDASESRRPLRLLVRGAPDLYDLAVQALSRVKAEPTDVLNVLNAFLIVASLRAWFEADGGDVSGLEDEPFHHAVKEVANGVRHLHLDESKSGAVRTQEAKKRTYGSDAYGTGPYGEGIVLIVPRLRGEDARIYSARRVLEDRLGAWATRLGRPAPDCS